MKLLVLVLVFLFAWMVFEPLMTGKRVKGSKGSKRSKGSRRSMGMGGDTDIYMYGLILLLGFLAYKCMNNGIEGFDGKPYCGSFKPTYTNSDGDTTDHAKACRMLSVDVDSGRPIEYNCTGAPEQGCIWVKNAGVEKLIDANRSNPDPKMEGRLQRIKELAQKKKEHKRLGAQTEYDEEAFCKYMEGADESCRMTENYGRACMEEDWYKEKCT